MDFEVSPELFRIYIEDARGHLEALDHALLSLERDGENPEIVTAVLGPLHTLKGNSGMMGFSTVKDYVHRLEDVFARIRDGALLLSPALFETLFAGASALRDAAEAAVRERREVRDLRAEIPALEVLLETEDLRPQAALAAVPATEPEAAPVETSPLGGTGAFPARKVDGQHVATRSSLVRVDFAQLDHLLNLVGELIIYRTKLQELGRQTAQLLAGQESSRELQTAVAAVAGVATQLQETIMDIRMLPIKTVFDRFPRLVRDLAKSQGKEVELIIEGEGTRVDKAIIDEIAEPLLHMIRNAVDHGLEKPAERVSAGKTATGTILLSAAQESNQVVITIMDDGRGIDPVQVRRVAVQRGILDAHDAVSDREAIQLIFSEGFSTAARVTDVSGRGVGLDVVLKSIERLNGLVEAESIPGVGTKFIIQLPLTLAIISALLVEVAGRTFALPLGAVVESLKYRQSEVVRMNGRDTLRIRDRIIPLLHLATAFDLAPSGPTGDSYAVILGRGDRRLGLSVDRLRGQQEIVIKALDSAVSGGAFGIAGATIMGDGTVVLILDTLALFEERRSSHAGRAATLPAAG
jgi:two-component system, chemotaxis family, sensor kinase CheA